MSSRTIMPSSPAAGRRGMTLVEMLIATTITLIIMGFVAEMFGLFGTGVSDSRSVIEMTDQLRAVAHRLRQDLAGVTAPTLPPLDPEQQQGYFEYIEGPAADADFNGNGPDLDGNGMNRDELVLTADCDDILLFTSRSSGDPFVGRFQAGTIESPVAEIGWFCKLSQPQVPGGPTLYTLYRRQLLVMGYVGAGPFLGTNEIAWPGTWEAFYDTYDLSCRFDPLSASVKPNTLGDLTKRESRFLHNTVVGGVPISVFPFLANVSPTTPPIPATGETLGLTWAGEDVVLTNVLSFDVRVFDPNAPIQVRGGTVDAVTPGDPGFLPASAGVARGAYVDLNWLAATTPSPFPLPPGATFPAAGTSAFSGLGMQAINGGTTNLLGRATYDTWSTHYEADGVDQDGQSGVDQGTNGFDDDSDGMVDEADERETSPPYPVALRGLEVRIRCYEPSSRQVRQVTVRHTFVPH